MVRRSELEQLISDIHSHHINTYTREIYLHSHYANDEEEEAGVDYRMATTFKKNLDLLEQKDHTNILINMHTGGGCWEDGMAIFHAIRFTRSPVTILAFAQASSMSGVIFQAADKRVLMPDTSFLIHHGSISLSDNSMAVKAAVDVNELNMKRMLQIFAKRAKIGKFFKEREYNQKKIERYIDSKIKNKSDWYLTAEEAVYYGFADGILGEPGFETIDKIRKTRKFKEKI